MHAILTYVTSDFGSLEIQGSKLFKKLALNNNNSLALSHPNSPLNHSSQHLALSKPYLVVFPNLNQLPRLCMRRELVEVSKNSQVRLR